MVYLQFLCNCLLTDLLHIIMLNDQLRMTTLSMDKLQLTGQNPGRVFNSRSGCMHDVNLHCFEAKLNNLKLERQGKQL